MAPPTTNRLYGPEADRLLYQGIFDEQPYYCSDSLNTYKWNAATSTWILDGFVGLNRITVGITPDPDPSVGDLWVNTA